MKANGGELMTKIGVMSDSHDNIFAIKKALNIFKQEQVELIFHCGDIVSPFALKLLLSNETPLRIVFGNNDGEKIINRQLINKHPRHRHADVVLTEKINDKQIAMTHGHIAEIKDLLLQSKNYDIVLTGHTHEKLQEVQENGVLHVNPGETCGWVTGSASIAIIDVESLSVRFKVFSHLPP